VNANELDVPLRDITLDSWMNTLLPMGNGGVNNQLEVYVYISDNLGARVRVLTNAIVPASPSQSIHGGEEAGIDEDEAMSMQNGFMLSMNLAIQCSISNNADAGEDGGDSGISTVTDDEQEGSNNNDPTYNTTETKQRMDNVRMAKVNE